MKQKRPYWLIGGLISLLISAVPVIQLFIKVKSVKNSLALGSYFYLITAHAICGMRGDVIRYSPTGLCSRDGIIILTLALVFINIILIFLTGAVIGSVVGFIIKKIKARRINLAS